MASNENKKQAEERELTEALAPEDTKVSKEEVVEEKAKDSTSKEDTKEVSEEKTADETAPEKAKEATDEATPESSSEVPGKATFEKAKNNQMALIAVVAIIVLLAVVFIFRGMGVGFGGSLTYENSVHGYSYSYPAELELVAEGNIPQELQDQGVQNMAQLNLTQGDSLLVRKTEDGGDNIVYTVLELSSRPNFGDFESYTTALFASLDESKELNGIEYELSEVTVGDGIASTEYSFEMEVPIDAEGNTRTGVFYDNVFQTEDGRAYSVSFGYPKDVANPEAYVMIYRDILSSFEDGEAVAEDAMESDEMIEEADDVTAMEEELEAPTEEVVEVVE